MIPARKNAAFNFVVRRWVGAALRRRFHGFYLAGGEHLAALPAGRGFVGCVNHTNWWDGFVLYSLSHLRLPHEIYLAMEERNLIQYRFFTRMGVFGVDLASGARNIAALRYAVNLLRQPPKSKPSLVWVFVQGELRPEQRSVQARPGAGFLARHSGAMLLPLVLRYAWLRESRPSIFVRVGKPLEPDATPEQIASAMNALLVETDQSLDPLDLAEYESVFSSGMSLNRRWDYARHLFTGKRESFDKSNH